MMQWDYRVFLEPDGDYTIREVFYAKDGSILGCTENEVSPTGRSLAELSEDMEAFTSALSKPVLTVADIPKIEKDWKRDRNGENHLSHEQVLAELGLERSEVSST